VTPKISETRERPPRLVGLVMREARSRREGESAGEAGEGDLEAVMMEGMDGVPVFQVLDLVWSGRCWEVLVARVVRAVSMVRGYSTGEVDVVVVAAVVPRGMKEPPFSPSVSTIRKSASVIRSIGSPPSRYVPWKIPARV